MFLETSLKCCFPSPPFFGFSLELLLRCMVFLLDVAVQAVMCRGARAHHGLCQVKHVHHVIAANDVFILLLVLLLLLRIVLMLQLLRQEGCLCPSMFLGHYANRVRINVWDWLHTLYLRVIRGQLACLTWIAEG